MLISDPYTILRSPDNAQNQIYRHSLLHLQTILAIFVPALRNRIDYVTEQWRIYANLHKNTL